MMTTTPTAATAPAPAATGVPESLAQADAVPGDAESFGETLATAGQAGAEGEDTEKVGESRVDAPQDPLAALWACILARPTIDPPSTTARAKPVVARLPATSGEGAGVNVDVNAGVKAGVSTGVNTAQGGLPAGADDSSVPDDAPLRELLPRAEKLLAAMVEAPRALQVPADAAATLAATTAATTAATSVADPAGALRSGGAGESTVARHAAPMQAHVGSQAWAGELASRIVWLAKGDVQSAALRLTPEHLGPLDVRISVRGDDAVVSFGASHTETRAALELALPRLREMFASQGLNLSQADVSEHAAHGHAAGTTHHALRGEERTAAAAEAAPVRERRGLLDLYA